MAYLKNTAGQNLGFALVSTADGSAVTGATVTARRSIDGGAQASATGAVSEKGNGQYNLAMSQADTNGDEVSFLFTASGAVGVEKTIAFSTSSGGGGSTMVFNWSSFSTDSLGNGVSLDPGDTLDLTPVDLAGKGAAQVSVSGDMPSSPATPAKGLVLSARKDADGTHYEGYAASPEKRSIAISDDGTGSFRQVETFLASEFAGFTPTLLNISNRTLSNIVVRVKTAT